MRSIEPLNPDVKPEVAPEVTTANTAREPPAEPTPAPTPQPSAALPTPAVPQPATGPAPTASPVNDFSSVGASIYPTSLSPEEKRLRDEQTVSERQSALKIPPSQIIIPAIAGFYALYLVVEAIKSAFSGGFALFGLYAFDSGGSYSKIIWLQSISSFILLVLMIVISYRIFRGSKVALALLTGPAILYLQGKLIVYAVALTGSSQLFHSRTVVIEMIIEVILAAMLIFAWTKDKKDYL